MGLELGSGSGSGLGLGLGFGLGLGLEEEFDGGVEPLDTMAGYHDGSIGVGIVEFKAASAKYMDADACITEFKAAAKAEIDKVKTELKEARESDTLTAALKEARESASMVDCIKVHITV